MGEQDLNSFLDKTWESPVFGDAFGEIAPDRLCRAQRQMSEIADQVTTDLTEYITEATPRLEQGAVLQVIKGEILKKTIAFCPALTAGELDDTRRLSDVATAVGLMYWADQTMDRGSSTMHCAVRLLDADPRTVAAEALPDVRRKHRALMRIEEKVRSFANPEDADLVLDCFYGQVLQNEACMRDLSIGHQMAGDRYTFLGRHAARIANTLTVNAGFPSIASSLYAVYRQHDASLPPLSDVYADTHMTEMLQRCNATVRLWDELGDWEMDQGSNPSKGVFALNLFNQHHPAIIKGFCDLAGIRDPEMQTNLQELFSTFHDSKGAREVNGYQIEGIFLDHIRKYMNGSPGELPGSFIEFGQYWALSRRVLEIGYANRVGDIALIDATEGTAQQS